MLEFSVQISSKCEFCFCKTTFISLVRKQTQPENLEITLGIAAPSSGSHIKLLAPRQLQTIRIFQAGYSFKLQNLKKPWDALLQPRLLLFAFHPSPAYNNREIVTKTEH
eukprot:TRINITY_DN700_c0_g1_i6.p1 TRINITY_DN700_c0_g1~~TRINITY_DN700_c0_g1_i6.p1  ORF type:complete len:109 (+),score=10.37 TRINITY_DN700_c0_g1_i6:399-725(+)